MAHRVFASLAAMVGAVALSVAGCKKPGNAAAAPPGSPGAQNVSLLLDWNPEPEFGGFYGAQSAGVFAKHRLSVTFTNTPGANAWQLVDSGKFDFATTAADQVLIARTQSPPADVVALFAVYQTCPQGIMVHKARGFTKLEDVFTHPGTLEAEQNPWLKYFMAQFNPIKVTLAPDPNGGVALFLEKPDVSQQCFITSEPLTAKAQDPSADPQTFLIADSGYNPYTTVLITSRKMLREHPDRVNAMVAACREGWRQYLADPSAANAAMEKLNPNMDAATFAKIADIQKPLIETDETKAHGLGAMTQERWKTLGQQLVKLGVIKQAPPAADCFVNLPDTK